MTKAVLLVATALVAGVGRAGWESWLKSGLYRASFENYSTGQVLSDRGAFNGTWGSPAVPANAEAKAVLSAGAGQYMSFSTEGTGLVFTPYSTGERSLKSILTSARLTGCESLPYPDAARGAFAIHAPEGGEPTFVGWTAGGWVDLETASVAPVSEEWYDVSMKFLRTNDVVSIQYRLKRTDGADYVTLHAVGDENKIWFPAGDGKSDDTVSDVEFQGEGAFRYVTGSEPRRGLLIGLVPWREMIIDESVYHHGSGDWYVFDYNTKEWAKTPSVSGDAYTIDVPNGEHYASFLPQSESAVDCEVVEFVVRFLAPNDNDATPTNDVCALVRVVEDPFTPEDVKKVGLERWFACLANGGWHTNTTVKADVDTDYTVEVRLDKRAQEVSYRVKKGRGSEAGVYQDLVMNIPVAIEDPLFTFFGGIGRVYGIRSSGQSSVNK